ncbi:MAG TPA: polyprenyl diphosphate synthase [Gemmatimonadaceae bacterium]|nr:polyprenyl diphosphate synthase [Gemmatimonadaceae bacterium]
MTAGATEEPLRTSGVLPRHVAIIMDGNGRWALSRGRARTVGHVAGARAVRRVVEQARRRGIEFLTLYAFSSDNWNRPREEVEALMSLFRRYLAAEVPRCVEHGIRLTVIGRRDRLSPDLRRAIVAAERATAGGTAMRLRIAVDYSARDLILAAAARLARHGGSFTRAEFSRALAREAHDAGDVPDVDLLIRTGGEQRLSDFLLWESAYAEFVFSRRLWPDFGAEDFDAALAEFRVRERRFGRISKAAG